MIKKVSNIFKDTDVKLAYYIVCLGKMIIVQKSCSQVTKTLKMNIMNNQQISTDITIPLIFDLSTYVR